MKKILNKIKGAFWEICDFLWEWSIEVISIIITMTGLYIFARYALGSGELFFIFLVAFGISYAIWGENRDG